MNKRLSLFFIAIIVVQNVFGQGGEAPNYANASTLPPGSAQASKMPDNLVNLFTGKANVSVPIYSFKNNSGLAISVSLEYSGGGVQVGEGPGVTGISWFLNPFLSRHCFR